MQAWTVHTIKIVYPRARIEASNYTGATCKLKQPLEDSFKL